MLTNLQNLFLSLKGGGWTSSSSLKIKSRVGSGEGAAEGKGSRSRQERGSEAAPGGGLEGAPWVLLRPDRPPPRSTPALPQTLTLQLFEDSVKSKKPNSFLIRNPPRTLQNVECYSLLCCTEN